MPITRYSSFATSVKSLALLLLVLTLPVLPGSIAAQSAIAPAVIVRMAPGQAPPAPAGTLVRRLGPDTYQLTYPARTARRNPSAALNADPSVLLWQADEAVTFRQTPTDELYPRQATHLELVGLPRAWDLTTGGTAPNGDRIVAAILDEGFDLAHEDILNNTWTNPGEIPNDGIDNDGNGFVDDLHGWNFKSDRPTFPSALHGQSVAGIIGAQGDNGIGTAGVNWSVDLMYFAIVTVSDIVAAYEYILDQRQRYNASQGREGSLVVVTNASFGVEGGRCSSYAVWADMYDRLGAAGVLTAASTAGRYWDVDVNGDMPTTCPTDYLIAVTNTDTLDRIWPSSGYGTTSVDLAAPGEHTYTTRPNNQYGTFGSTSAAAPYVTGAIALMYSLDCPLITERLRTDPAGLALFMRGLLLASVEPVPDLEQLTVTGGRLAVDRALDALLQECNAYTSGGGAEAGLRIQPNPTSRGGDIEVLNNALTLGTPYTLELYDSAGRLARRSRQPGGFAGSPLVLPTVGLAGGLYFMHLSGGGLSEWGRVVVR